MSESPIERFTVYITRYALSGGIKVVEVESRGGSMVQVVDNRQEFYHLNDWHHTPEEAIAHAETMRAAKLASLRNQIAKLEKLDFAKAVR